MLTYSSNDLPVAPERRAFETTPFVTQVQKIERIAELEAEVDRLKDKVLYLSQEKLDLLNKLNDLADKHIKTMNDYADLLRENIAAGEKAKKK